jgi:hypothetical protein
VKDLVDLHGKFARGREYQRPRGQRIGTAIELGDTGKDGQAERGCLAGSRLRDTEDVPTLQLRRDRLCLDGGGSCEPGLVEGAQDGRRLAVVGDVLVDQQVYFIGGPDHAAGAAARIAPAGLQLCNRAIKRGIARVRSETRGWSPGHFAAHRKERSERREVRRRSRRRQRRIWGKRPPKARQILADQ